MDCRARRLGREKEARERDERRRKAEEEERIRREEERRLKIRRLKILDEPVSNWYRNQKIRQFVEAVQKIALWRYGTIEPGSKLDKCITWATYQANKLDPIIMRFPYFLNDPEYSLY